MPTGCLCPFNNFAGYTCALSESPTNSMRIPTKAATYSNLIAATIPI